jgi:hypothetical protein
MKQTTKIFLIALAVLLLAVLSYQGYLTVRYRLHNGHRAIVSVYTGFEEGRPFTSIDSSQTDVPGMVLAAENDILKLYVEELSGNIALYDKRSGETVYAVPPEAADDPIASGINQSLLQSQISIDYFTAARFPAIMNSFDHAVAFNQVRLESLENGLRVIYTMGDTSSPTGRVPVYITRERLELFLAPLEGTREYSRNMARYSESTVAPGHLELLESVRTGQATLREMDELFERVGYTMEDFASDMEGSGVDAAIPLHFVIPLDFKLVGDSLIAEINTSRIREYSGGRIAAIQLMRAFGAGGTDDEGYLVVPNGSGSLIRFNNQKTYADEYMQFIYGQDPLLREYATLGNIEPVRIPFFGIENENYTVLARMESGESQAYLTAGISGKFNSYNYVYPGYVLRGSMSLAMFGLTGNEATLPIVERDLPLIDIVVRYTLLAESGYSGMASRARELLIEDGTLKAEPSNQDDIPFYMDLIGSVMGQKFFAGVSYMGQIPMTNYSEAAGISAELTSNGVKRQIINYQGWYNRGYYHDVADRIRPIRRLGNTGELESLARILEAQGGGLYSDVNILTVPWSSRRYRYELESSRYYGGGMVAGFGLVNPITFYNTFSMGYLEVMYNTISPRFITRYTGSYINAVSRYDFTGTSLRDMGDVLASDRRRTEMIHREQAKEVVQHSFELLQEQGKPLMVTGGNIYSLRYCEHLINMPLAHNVFYVVDEEIPFYQMIIHGRISYAGSPINLSDAFDEDQIVLRLVEYGASPHFAFTHNSASEMRYTGLNVKYSTRYLNWNEMATRIYHSVNDALSPVSGMEMQKHEILPDGLRRITYSGGVQIIINRSNEERVLNGEIISPVSYVVKEVAA